MKVGMAVRKSKETRAGWSSLLHCFGYQNGMIGQHKNGCSITLVTNQPILVSLFFCTAIPTSTNNFCNCFLYLLLYGR